MSSGLVRFRSVACLFTVLGCSAPGRHGVAHEPYLVRFELATLEHPASLDAWYACFETEDVERRKLCLGDVPGVRVDAGHGASCAEASDATKLCRAFPYFTPDRVAAEDEVESDDDSGGGVAGAVAEGFFELLGALLLGALEDDDDADDHDEEERPRVASKRSSSRDRRHTISKPEPRREYHTKPPRKR